MIIGLAAVAACIAVTALAAAPARTGPASTPAPGTAALLPFPTEVTFEEVEWLVGHRLPRDLATEICRIAAARQVPPALLWAWAEAYGPMLLALALISGSGRRELALTSTAGAELDRESMELLAELNGGRLGSALARASRSSDRRAA